LVVVVVVVVVYVLFTQIRQSAFVFEQIQLTALNASN
jgi:hypothetical protein